VSRIAREGTTVVLVTHHVEEIIPEIEHVVLLKRGQVAFAGPKSSILTPERLSSVMDAPIALQEINGYYYAKSQE